MSTSAGSRALTVGMRTSACSFATARSPRPAASPAVTGAEVHPGGKQDGRPANDLGAVPGGRGAQAGEDGGDTGDAAGVRADEHLHDPVVHPA